MKPSSKKNLFQVIVAALILAILFVPSLDVENVRAYLNKSSTSSYETEIIWGQAYSPKIGWINFYCDGAGNAQPPDVRVNYANLGVATMSDACGSVAYQAEYDPTSKQFSGSAYSSNYGWLDMSDVEMDAPVFTEDIVELTGSSTGSGLGSPYNFGETYFEADNPNSFNPGVRYYNQEGYFCGFAYSEAVGYISFCDPQTKERSPKNISVPNFDWDSYAVYLGVPEYFGTDEIGEFGGTLNASAPTLTTAAKVLAATDSYDDVLWFMDDASDIASVEVKIYDAQGAPHTYTADYFDPYGKRASIDISDHDFSTAANYNLTYTACDNLGNCSTNYVIPDFFQVVAAAPSFVSPANSYFQFTTGNQIADGVEHHSVAAHLIDAYGNPVISVDGIKSVSAEFVFENTTDLDQIAKTGDSAIFTASEFSLNQAGGTTTGFLTEATGGDGQFQIDVSSLAPTSAGYEPLATLGFDLNFAQLNYKVEGLDSYTNVGEATASVASTDANRVFGFAPTLFTTPTALIWNATTDVYEIDSAGIENITINAPKRFNISIQNQSTNVDTSTPQIGIALDNGASSNVEWSNGTIETAGSATNLDESLPLDIDTNTTFDGTMKNLATWISGVAISSIDSSTRFQATPILDLAATAAEDLDTTLQTYVCYDLSGNAICHRGDKLEGGSSTANLYNPGIEILGSIRSISGTASKQTDLEVNQSLGDVVQNEFQDAINRNLASLLANPSDACTSNTTVESASELLNLSCWQRENSVLYIRNSDLTLNLTGGLLPSGARTLVIENGNLHIKSDLSYPSAGGSLGVIVLSGDIFIYPDVTNLVGVTYAEGSIISVNDQGQSGEDVSSTCDGTAGFCDRSYELRNQLHWKGILATQNTIGGSDKSPVECPADITCSSRDTARIYDLAYLRTFHPNSGGSRASGTSSDASFVVEYDSRIQSDTPPLFEAISASSGTEIGN